MSSSLLYNAENTLIPCFTRILECNVQKYIRVTAKSTDVPDFHGKAVGCACSMGVDSFTSIIKHSSDEVQPEYRLTHLTLFNSGQLGDQSQEELSKNLKEATEKIRPVAVALNLPILNVNSNMHELNHGIVGVYSKYN